MKDVYFNDYDKKSHKKDSKYDTSEIPITNDEREFQERINRQRYEEIMRNQNRKTSSSNDYYANYNGDNYYADNNGEKKQTRRAKSDNESHENISSNSPKNSKQSKKNKQKKKKGCGCATIFICFILIIALACGGSLGYLYSLCSKTNYEKSASNQYISSSQLKKSSDIFNVLLIGIDTDEENTSRSDTMMLVSIDKTSSTIKFTSFMRDMWVEIPDYKEAKINAAYSHGGAQLVMDTIEYNFKIDIDNYVLVDFDMFKKLIDGMGGVTVDITEKEAEFINRTSHAKVKAGTNTLNGDYALIYCRIRKLDSDFMRTQRQRKVMAALLQKVESQSIFKTMSALTDVLPLITTDISPMKLTALGLSSVGLLTYGNDQLQVPGDDLYYSDTIQGQDALVPDLDGNTKAIQTFIYG